MMMRLNLLLLMTTGFLPFPTGILAESLRAPDQTAETAVVLYGATVLVIELVMQGFVRYAASHPDLAAGRRSNVEAARRSSAGRRWLSPTIVLYAGAICGGLIGFPKVAAFVYLALAIHGVLLIESHRRNVRSSKPA
jgi:uncharacterized membrane protein